MRDGIMGQLIERNQPPTFLCQEASHVHSGAYSRRGFLGGLAVSAASTLLADQQARAQATPGSEKPFRIDTHHHLSSPGFIAEIAGRRTGQVPLMRWTVAQSIDDMDLGGVARRLHARGPADYPTISRDGVQTHAMMIAPRQTSAFRSTLQCRCRSRARASLRNRHEGPSSWDSKTRGIQEGWFLAKKGPGRG